MFFSCSDVSASVVQFFIIIVIDNCLSVCLCLRLSIGVALLIKLQNQQVCLGFLTKNLDAVALQIYMELLLPSDEELQQSKTRFSWCKRILRIRQTADSMMGKTCFLEPTEDVATYGEKARQVITTCRYVRYLFYVFLFLLS